MRAEGPKERPTACYALGRARVLRTTLFGKPRPLPNMVAFGYTDDLKHSSIARMRSWALLRAFGPHELLLILS